MSPSSVISCVLFRTFSRPITYDTYDEQAVVEKDPVFANHDNMFMSRPERYRHGLSKSRRVTALKEELSLRCA